MGKKYEEAVHYDPVAILTKQPEYRMKLEYYKDALQAGREVIKNCKCKLGYGTDFVATHMNYESGYEYRAWKRDLLTDPYALLDCAFVMKEGIVYPTEKCEDLED